LGPGQDRTPRGDQGTRSNASPFKHHGVHADDCPRRDLAAFQQRAVTDRDIRADDGPSIDGHVQDAVILHVAAGTDNNRLFAVIGAQHVRRTKCWLRPRW